MCKKDWRLLQAYKATGLTPDQVVNSKAMLDAYRKTGVEPHEFSGLVAEAEKKGKAILDLNDAIRTIAQFSQKAEQMKIENAALLADVQRCCATCANCSDNNGTGAMCPYNFDCNQIDGDHWEWRGATGTPKEHPTMIPLTTLLGEKAFDSPSYAACLRCEFRTWSSVVCSFCARKYANITKGASDDGKIDNPE